MEKSKATEPRAVSGVAQLYAFSVNSAHFLLHVPTSRVFQIDVLTKEVVDLLRRRASEEDLIQKLKSRYDEEKVREVVEELKGAELIGTEYPNPRQMTQEVPQDKFKVDYLMLILVGDCNLRCDYCFAEQGRFGNESSFMSWEVAKTAVDFLLGESKDKPYMICFFGGEPLLNFPLLRKTVLYAKEQFSRRSQQIGFSVTTNGTILTEEISEFLNENRFGILVSLDGPQPIHDRWRKFKNGKGSHTTVVANAQRMISCWNAGGRKSKLMGRSTVTAWEPDLKKIVPYLEELGFPLIAAEPVYVSPLGKGEYALEGESLRQYKQSFERLVKSYREDLVAGKPCAFHFLMEGLKIIFEGQQKHYPCGAGRLFSAVAPNGDIFPCHRLIGEENYRIGSVFTGIDESLRIKFFPRLVLEKETCRSCWARYFCGGGCPAEQILVSGDDARPLRWRCDLFRHHLKWNIWLYNEVRNAQPELISQIMADASLEKRPELDRAL